MLRRALLAVVAVAALLAAPVRASGDDLTPTAAPPRVDAAAYYLVGGDGVVLARYEARQRRAIASITKLMTAVVTLERAELGEVVTVPSRAAALGGSTAYLRAGERLTVADLLRAMLVWSANDAAEALALYVGQGSEPRFVTAMNAKARALGLTDTHFANPHGLDVAGHVSSARDTTLLVRYALGVPFVQEALGRTSVSLPGGREFPSTDELLASWPPLVGGKTGHTDDAGWSQAAGAEARGATVYGTVLGTTGPGARDDALRTLLRYGLDRYRRVAVVDAGRVYAEAGTGYGRPAVELVAPRTIVRSLLGGTSLVERVFVPESVGVPVRKGAAVGRVEVYAGDRLLASSNLVAASDVSEPGVFGKAWWYVRTTAGNLWDVVT
ncbi:MAG TPA: D-alanyl-D-alanine carboxypeptidase family protein [Gaiellaceae bacterium]|nr:D-alanyl-D-alanine carboxypeptidase family protein [Gaiellaceae bacterium]